MAYIVVYQREDGSSGLEECADLDLAIVTAERLRNVDSIERPRIMKTEELTYDFKPYYRVEVTAAEAAEAASDATATTAAVPPPPAPPAPVAEPIDTPATDEPAETVEVSVANDDIVEEPAARATDTVTIEPMTTEASTDEADASEDAESGDATMDEPSVETDTDESGGGLFGGRDAVAERLGDFPSVPKEDEDSVPSRRGLFGR